MITQFMAVQITSVKCISPSSGLDAGSLLAAEFAGMVVGAAGGTAIAVLSGGSGSVAVPLGTILGSAAATAGTYALDKYVAGDADDLYIRVDDNKVWPSGDSKSIESQQTRSVGFTKVSQDDVKIALKEYDSVSSNDKLGSYTVKQGTEPGFYRPLVTSSSEPASLYQLDLLVWSADVTLTSSPTAMIQDIEDAKQEFLQEMREEILELIDAFL